MTESRKRGTEQPLGDARIWITWVLDEPEDRETALLTVRGKDHDVTPSELRAIAAACTKVARILDRSRGRKGGDR